MSFRSLFAIVMTSLLLSGAAAAETVEFEDSWGAPGFNLVSSSSSGVEIVFSVPRIHLGEISADGRTMDTVSIPGVVLPNDPGAPNLPGMSRLIAFPQGANYSVEIKDYRSVIIDGLDVVPAEPIPFEGDDSPPLYRKNAAIYERDAVFPQQPVVLSEPKVMRGVDAFFLGVTPFAYNPVQKRLEVFTDMRIKVTFTGGNGIFGDVSYRSRWLEPMMRQHIFNYASLPAVDFDARVRSKSRSDECEYMIFSPGFPNFLAWAETIKEHRMKQGIVAEVYDISDFGSTAGGIESKINQAYTSWQLKPVAVLLLGDTPAMPTQTWSGVLSDNIYADVNDDDLPDLNVARITARDDSELDLLVNKFIDYEFSPPTNPGFYANPIMAGGWQTERWFILCTEVVHGFMTNVEGKSPVREYAIYSGYPGSQWSTNQNTYMITDYFGPNGYGYIPATPSHLTDWGGNATRINSDINSGAFYMLHRDHGYEIGWGEPDYDVNDLGGLSNSDLPFVMSINCLTGHYSYNPECFAEAFHRMQHGALGVIAASHISYSFVNDTFVWGMHDSMWPGFDPGYGGSSGDNMYMPGFANMSGKWYLMNSSWPYNTSNKVITYHLFHMHGDAFTQVCTEVPQNLTVTHANSIDTMATSFDVTADAGSFIGLYSDDGRLLGSATGTGSQQTIDIIMPGFPGTMYVTVTKANHVRYEGVVSIAGASVPIPDVKANGQDGPIFVPYGTPVTITLSLDPGGFLGVDQDIWVFVQENWDTTWYWRPPNSWTMSTSPILTLSGPLFNVNNFVLVNNTPLPHRNTWIFYLAVDDMDGVYQGTFIDSCAVGVY